MAATRDKRAAPKLRTRTCAHICAKDTFRGSWVDNRTRMVHMSHLLARRAALLDASVQWTRSMAPCGKKDDAERAIPPSARHPLECSVRHPLLPALMLRRLHRLATDCQVVLYTAVFGGYDSLHDFFRNNSREHDGSPVGNARRICRFSFVDRATSVKETDATLAGWVQFEVEPLPFASMARSAHAFKTVPWALFPRAEWVLYMDGKVLLKLSAAHLVASWSSLTAERLPRLFVLQHPISQVARSSCEEAGEGCGRGHPLLEEMMQEREWLIKRKQASQVKGSTLFLPSDNRAVT